MKLSAWTFLGVALLTGAGWGAKPNIVLILVDDMGFSDIGCYGGEIPTPNLDRLASHGARFSQFYNTGHRVPFCVTRAEVLTDAGYSTWMGRKWHLGHPGPIERWLNRTDGLRCEAACEYAEEALEVLPMKSPGNATSTIGRCADTPTKRSAPSSTLAPFTVKVPMAHIFEKLHVRSRVEAAVAYLPHTREKGSSRLPDLPSGA